LGGILDCQNRCSRLGQFFVVFTPITRKYHSGRCSLGITTVLSVIKIGFDGKGKPQVNSCVVSLQKS